MEGPALRLGGNMAWFWMIAGPNGAGKSTLVEHGVVHTATGLDLISLNADVRTRELRLADPDI